MSAIDPIVLLWYSNSLVLCDLFKVILLWSYCDPIVLLNLCDLFKVILLCCDMCVILLWSYCVVELVWSL
jgi:hypothetical protein